jgi:hypothetical protein
MTRESTHRAADETFGGAKVLLLLVGGGGGWDPRPTVHKKVSKEQKEDINSYKID